MKLILLFIFVTNIVPSIAGESLQTIHPIDRDESICRQNAKNLEDWTKCTYIATKAWNAEVNKYYSLLHKKLKDCYFNSEVLVVGIVRNEELFIPNGNSEFFLNDKVILMGTPIGLDIAASELFESKGSVKKIAIIGGGSVGFELASELERTQMNLKIIESDYNTPELKERYAELVEQQKNNPINIYIDLFSQDGDIPLQADEWFQKAKVGGLVFRQTVTVPESRIAFLERACKWANFLKYLNKAKNIIKLR